MYTQCPDCGISFRVTAVVLKQAAGKVRCGGCGHAFNSLAYLSESKPDTSERTVADGTLPELTPGNAATRNDTPPESISPEQSAALLKTLDQLAGEDIRLEDTGIEWRIVSDKEEKINKGLDRTPTRVDEFLTKTPTLVEAGEIFEDPTPSIVESVEVFENADEWHTRTVAEELRFDDDTGLPEDFEKVQLPPPTLELEPEAKRDIEEESGQVDLALGDPEDWGELLDEVEVEPEAEDEQESELEKDVEKGATHDELDEIEDKDEASSEHIVPPPTDEELTVNMQIDQELFALAIEDEDGFASTIVIEDKRKIEEAILKEASSSSSADQKKETSAFEKLKNTGSGFETIIMEGEAVRSALEQEALAADKLAGKEAKPKFVLPKEIVEEEPSSNKRYGMIAGVVILVLLLAAQIVHQSRASIAQVPAISNVISPLYRSIGAPITPNWDVSGWRIEVTKGSTNPIAEFVDGNPVVAKAEADVEQIDDTAGIVGGEDEVLTIYSRVANKSDNSLPYPLISISLLDRFDEVIGNQVLEPARYLTGDFDPRVPVSPGDTFNAVISIESPSTDAAGFRVQICYRQSSELLRCAVEAFR